MTVGVARVAVPGPWPLVGRDEELRLLTAHLVDPDSAGLLLAGEAGTGKSRLARELLATASRLGHPTEAPIVASAAAATIPLGAFAHLLPPDATAATPGALSAAVAALADRGGARRLVLVVDDVHLLDDASIALLHRVMLERTVFTLTTTRTGDPVPPAVVALWKDVDAARLEVQPLSRDETTELVETALGGRLETHTARVLWELSQGNPLFLRESTLAALRSGHLTRQRDVWTVDTDGLAPPTSLVELVTLRLRALSPVAGEAADTLAVAGALGVAALARLHGDAAVVELEQAGLLQVDADDRRRTARLAHPLHGEVIRERAGSTRTGAAAGRLAAQLEELGARRRGDGLLLATWRLHAGQVADPTAMVHAAREAYAGGDYGLARRLVALVRREDPDDVGAILLQAQLDHEHGRHSTAEATYAALPATDDPDVAGRVAVGRAVNLFFGLGDPETADRVLVECATRVPATAAVAAANRAWLALNLGDPARAADLVVDLRDTEDPETRRLAEVTTAWAYATAGRPAAALAAADRATELLHTLAPTRLNRFRDFPDLPRTLALLADGDLAGAAEVIARGRLAAVDGHPRFVQGWWAYLAACVGLASGDLAAAADGFREGAVIQTQLHQPGFLRRDLAGLALTAALRGDAAAARGHLAEHDALGERPERLHAALTARARAWTAWAEGDLVATRAHLRDGAAEAQRAGLHADEVTVRGELVRVGDGPAQRDRLAALAASGGRLAALWSAAASAEASGDHAGVADVASRLAERGLQGLAADAWATAADVASRGGAGRAAQQHRRRAAAVSEVVGGARTPALARVVEVVALTPREREVVTMAATGTTNRQIAEHLGIAKRTVDNLLHRAYGKLGVASREEAAAVLAGET